MRESWMTQRLQDLRSCQRYMASAARPGTPLPSSDTDEQFHSLLDLGPRNPIDIGQDSCLPSPDVSDDLDLDFPPDMDDLVESISPYDSSSQVDVYNETFLTATPEPISFECTISPKSAGPPVKNSTGGGCVGAKMCSGGQQSGMASTSSAIPHRLSADELRANNTKIHLKTCAANITCIRSRTNKKQKEQKKEETLVSLSLMLALIECIRVLQRERNILLEWGRLRLWAGILSSPEPSIEAVPMTFNCDLRTFQLWH